MNKIEWYRCEDCTTMIQDGKWCDACFKRLRDEYREKIDALKGKR